MQGLAQCGEVRAATDHVVDDSVVLAQGRVGLENVGRLHPLARNVATGQAAKKMTLSRLLGARQGGLGSLAGVSSSLAPSPGREEVRATHTPGRRDEAVGRQGRLPSHQPLAFQAGDCLAEDEELHLGRNARLLAAGELADDRVDERGASGRGRRQFDGCRVRETATQSSTQKKAGMAHCVCTV